MANILVIIFIWSALIITNIGAWLTHIVICLADDRISFLVIGLLFVPIGIIHGWGNWIGFWH